MDLVDVVGLTGKYLSNLPDIVWERSEMPSSCLAPFNDLPVKRSESNGKWYCYAKNSDSGASSICLGCAIFSGNICKAVPQCPLSLCRTCDCLFNAHPIFQLISCYMKHHTDRSMELHRQPAFDVDDRETDDDGAHPTVARQQHSALGIFYLSLSIYVDLLFHINIEIVSYARLLKRSDGAIAYPLPGIVVLPEMGNCVLETSLGSTATTCCA